MESRALTATGKSRTVDIQSREAAVEQGNGNDLSFASSLAVSVADDRSKEVDNFLIRMDTNDPTHPMVFIFLHFIFTLTRSQLRIVIVTR